MRSLPEIADRIAEARKTVRYEQRFYCPHDGRMVAAVVPFEGERYLWIVGGRDEHARSLLSELFQQLASHRDEEHLEQERASGLGMHRKIHLRLLDAYRRILDDGHAVTPPAAYLIADDFYRLTVELGHEPLPHHAPCPRCHRSAVLRVTPEGVSQD